MLSSKALKYLVRAINIADAIGSTPYRWDGKKKRVVFVDTVRRKCVYYIHNFVHCCYLAFLWLRWIQIAFSWESPYSPSAMATLYGAVAYNLVTAIQWSVFTNYGLHHLWINHFLGLGESFGGTGHGSRIGKKALPFDCRKFCRIFMIAASTIFTLDTLSYFSLPDSPFFVSSLVPEGTQMTTLLLLPFACFHMYIWFYQWTVILFYIQPCMCYFTSVKNILAELSPRNTIGWNELDKNRRDEEIDSRDPKWFSEKDHQLEVVQSIYNKLWSTSNALSELVLLSANTLAYYGAVRLDGARSMHQFVVAIVVTYVLVKIWGDMGQVYEISLEVLHSWKRVGRSPWFTKYLKSVRPIRVQLGGFFYADRGIKLTIISIVLNNTSTLLLST